MHLRREYRQHKSSQAIRNETLDQPGSVLRDARKSALDEMSKEAAALGANAVLSVDIDYETVGQGMLMVTACGTAVVIQPG